MVDSNLYAGLMSGTSANGIDAALVELSEDGFRFLSKRSQDYSAGVKDAIESVILNYHGVNEDDIHRLDKSLGEDFARAAEALLEESGTRRPVAAIGSHGQTVYHGPDDEPPVTIQLADPQVIADRTGITTVGDFRRNDMREGGQGAPLAPAFHNAMFRHEAIDRLILNIGGIGNLTWLPADRSSPVIGFDTGPANTLMDQWCRTQRGDAYDANGAWALQGRAKESFVNALLADPYFGVPAPKSTGREYFHLDWVKKRYPQWRDETPVDIQAGLLEVSARSIADASSRICGNSRYEMYVCGGGTHNDALMSRLEELVSGEVMTTEALGLPPDWVEACAFAWLAYRRLQGLPGNLPSVTGARREVLLGEIYAPAQQRDSHG